MKIISSAMLVLHSMLITSSVWSIYHPTGQYSVAVLSYINWKVIQGHLRNDICINSIFPLEILARRCIASKVAKEVRDIYADYFMNEEEVE